MSRWIQIVTSSIFLWTTLIFPVPGVAALDPSSQKLKNFFDRTGMTKKAIPLAEFYRVNKQTIPLDLRFEIENLLKNDPKAILPKLETRTIKKGSREILEVTAQVKGQSAVMTFDLSDEVAARVVYTQGGKSQSRLMSPGDALAPVRFLSDLRGTGPGLSEMIGFVRLLRPAEVASFSQEDRDRYFNQVKDLLEAAEKAQQKLNPGLKGSKKKGGRKTAHLLFQWIEVAWAKESRTNGTPCLSMGHVGFIKDGVCVPPESARSSVKGCYTCNSKIFGSSMGFATCGKTNLELTGSDKTTIGYCFDQMTKVDSADRFKGVATPEELRRINDSTKAEFDALSMEINKLAALCRFEGAEADKECKDLQAKIQDLRRANCKFIDDFIATQKAPPSDLRCYFDPQDAIQVKQIQPAQEATTQPPPAPGRDERASPNPSTQPPPAPRAPAPSVAAPAEAGIDDGDYSSTQCAGLPTEPDSLNCGGGSVRTTTCRSRTGAPQTFYFCDCGSSRPVYENAARPTRCEGGRYTYERNERGSRSRAPRAGSSPGWGSLGGSDWVGPMLGIAGALGILWLGHYATKSQLERNYQQLTPTPLQIAPPPTGGLPAPVPGGAPVIMGR